MLLCSWMFIYCIPEHSGTPLRAPLLLRNCSRGLVPLRLSGWRPRWDCWSRLLSRSPANSDCQEEDQQPAPPHLSLPNTISGVLDTWGFWTPRGSERPHLLDTTRHLDAVQPKGHDYLLDVAQLQNCVDSSMLCKAVCLTIGGIQNKSRQSVTLSLLLPP